ncbi:RluA family pseudouridine synthase [Paenibacillus harenae]|uniref:RluA family pseudouridine synthase n=1 Tax=Paenibacillus harenae TaxID=306543 RepID=UPI00279150AA|nr:RNA pseudouridine synthase [Paenibacillus harenae]MDQ0058101.1 23S rRNA pseudouridine1911/1915/1917 synthase [Paenibacillus harenae]
MSIPILFEDNHLLVVEKPPGIPSQEDETGDADMLTLLKQDLKERYNKPGNVFLGLVHRLDRPVGGAMLFAKTSKAASRLSESIRSRSFGKTYVCIVQGIPAVQNATLKHYIRKDNKRNQVTVYNQPAEDAKEAILSFEVAAASGKHALVAIRLHTGRPHQIRAQLSHIGYPLVGDLKYGAAKTAGISDIALWSTSISVEHPVTKEDLLFTSSPSGSACWDWWSNDQLARASSLLITPDRKD